MKAIFVDEILNGWGLQAPEFSILKPDAELAHILFMQPKGEIVVKSDHVHIGNYPSADTTEKYLAFFRLADSKNAHLATTPEYSCPMEVIQEVIAGEVFPKLGKIWVFGGESITKQGLQALEIQIGEIGGFVHFDRNVLDQPNNFVDPVFYLLKAKNSDGEPQKIVLIQFKSAPMGVWTDSRERDWLITGKEIYVLRNPGVSINLFTLNCSDALNHKAIFEAIGEIDPAWMRNPYLILHLQLNPKPADGNFSEYRRTLISHQKNFELLCVNWARGTGEKENDRPKEWVKFSGTSFSITSNEIALDESTFHQNYFQGCYLINGGKGRYSYYFHSEEWVFYLKTTKVNQVENAMHPQMRRSGITGVEAYIWDNEKWAFPINSKVHPDHSFFEDWTHMKELLSESLRPLDIERIIELSTGSMNLKLDPTQWWKIDTISSLKLTDNESILSITFSQDRSNEAESKRREKADNFQEIQQRLIHDPRAFPDSLKKFVGSHSGKVRFKLDHPHSPPTNLSLRNDSDSMTVVYLGSVTEAYAKDFESRFKAKFYGQNGRRLLIWFKKGGENHFLDDGSPVLITDNIPRQPSSEIASITSSENHGRSITRKIP